MADDRDLDDFFARKTKKKTKAKGKAFTTSTKIAQNVEQLQHVAREREHAHLQPAPEKPAVQNPEDEEWNDFQEEVVKDLSGLKIIELKKSSSQTEQADLVGEQEPVEDDVPLVKSESNKAAGPWQVVASTSPIPSAAEVVKPTTLTSQDLPAEQSDKKYRPGAFGAMKNKGLAQQSQTSWQQSQPSWQQSQSSWRTRRKAPDVTSEEAFPSLHQSTNRSQSGNYPSADSMEGFRDVKNGIRPPDCSREEVPLAQANKFDALSNSN